MVLVMQSTLQKHVRRTFLLTLLLLLMGSPGFVRSQEARSEITVEEAERMLLRAFDRFHQATSFCFTCKVDADSNESDEFFRSYPVMDTFRFRVVNPDKVYIESDEMALYQNQSKVWVYSKALGEYLVREDIGILGPFSFIREYDLWLGISLSFSPRLLYLLPGAADHKLLKANFPVTGAFQEERDGRLGYRIVLKSDEYADAGSIWIDQETGLIGEMISTAHRSSSASSEETETTRDIVMHVSDIEIGCEIPEETFVFSPHPRDRLVEQRSVSDDTPAAALEPSLHLVRGIDDELGAENIESMSSFKIGRHVDALVWYDLDDDDRYERIVASNGVLAIIAPDGSLRERIYLQGGVASWSLTGIIPVEIGKQLYWFASFTSQDRSVCALYSRAGEERWYFYPEIAAETMMGIEVDDINGDDQPEMIVWLNAEDEELGSRYSYLFILDALGQRLVQQRLGKWIDSVDLIEPEDPNDPPKLLLLFDSKPAPSHAGIYNLDLSRSQASKDESRALD
jgi:outer membrane lipoprotein-sorting protein